MTMKKILLITVLFLSVFTLAQAQRNTGQRPSKGGEGGGPGRMNPAERVERQTQRLNEALTLSADQMAKVKAIYTKNAEENRKAFEKARAGEQADREKMHEQMKASLTKQDSEIKALLTPEQKLKFEKFVKEREERMKNWQGRQNGGNGPGQNKQ